jgi:hypothetical protein
MAGRWSKGEKPDTRDFWTKIIGGTHLYIPVGQIGNLNVRYEMPRASVKRGILKSFNEEEVLKALIARLKSESQTLTVTLGRSAPQSDQAQVPQPPKPGSTSGTEP